MMKGLGYGKGYKYPHDYEGGLAPQSYLPDQLSERIYYDPSERGYEIRIREFLARARQTRANASRRGGGNQNEND